MQPPRRSIADDIKQFAKGFFRFGDTTPSETKLPTITVTSADGRTFEIDVAAGMEREVHAYRDEYDNPHYSPGPAFSRTITGDLVYKQNDDLIVRVAETGEEICVTMDPLPGDNQNAPDSP